jgi:transcriptional regulator with XRE-family HTH domain
MLDTKIGPRIKEQRSLAGISLRELARRTELTPSFISQLENNKTNVSLDSLRRIAEALNVSLLYFLADTLSEISGYEKAAPVDSVESGVTSSLPEAKAYSPVVKADSRAKLILPVAGDSNVIYEKLGPDIGRTMGAFCGRLKPGTGNIARKLREPTEEFIYVLSGVLLIVLDYGEYVLNPNDTIYFDGEALREISCFSDNEEAVWISVITPAVF